MKCYPTLPHLKIVFFLFLFTSIHPVKAQVLKKTMGWIVHHSLIDTTDPGQSSFRIYPTLAYSPETKLEIGFSTLYLFQAKKDTNNRISEINAFSFFTMQSQYGIWLDNAIYGDKDKWFILGRTRFQKFPLLYYGIGPDAPEEHPAVIDANYFILRQRVLRKIKPNLFLGPEVDYQNLFNTNVEHHADDPIKETPPGSDGSSNLGLGAALVYDNRHNVLNVRKGLFAELGVLSYSNKLASTSSFTGINADVRAYFPVTKKNVVAVQFTGNVYTGDVPFNQMALMGGEIMMRGYYYGRFRDKNMLASQVEYRLLPFSFSKRIGATAFLGTAAVAPGPGSFRLDNFKLAGGAGLRYLLFPKKDIFLRFDVGITKEGIGFYFFTGEAF
ncbi:BamA/TamA family outer membrane protein [Flavitalea antarctica]